MSHPLVTAARKYTGDTYVWGGKRDYVFSAQTLSLRVSPWLPRRVFDCSGLVTVALLDSGGPDWRGSHSSGALRAVAKPVLMFELQEGDLLFRVGHVAIYVGPSQEHPLNIVVIEAAGGDRATVSPMIAEARNASVQEHTVSPSRFTVGGRLDINRLITRRESNGTEDTHQ